MDQVNNGPNLFACLPNQRFSVEGQLAASLCVRFAQLAMSRDHGVVMVITCWHKGARVVVVERRGEGRNDLLVAVENGGRGEQTALQPVSNICIPPMETEDERDNCCESSL